MKGKVINCMVKGFPKKGCLCIYSGIGGRTCSKKYGECKHQHIVNKITLDKINNND